MKRKKKLTISSWIQTAAQKLYWAQRLQFEYFTYSSVGRILYLIFSPLRLEVYSCLLFIYSFININFSNKFTWQNAVPLEKGRIIKGSAPNKCDNCFFSSFIHSSIYSFAFVLALISSGPIFLVSCGMMKKQVAFVMWKKC